MTTGDALRVNVLYWDAQKAYNETGGADPSVEATIQQAAERVARAAATGGLAVVLPGDSPDRAVLITADGAGDNDIEFDTTVGRT